MSLRPKGFGVLMLACGDNVEILGIYEHDAKLLSNRATEFWSHIALTSIEVIEYLEKYRPQVLYLVARFDTVGTLCGVSGASVRLGYIMKRAEQMGVRLFIIAVENDLEHLRNNIINSDSMNIMFITKRNRHYDVFMKALIERMSISHKFASAYVDLAPQHGTAQVGRPLPGSLAICPAETGKGIVLWSEPQE